MWTAPAIAAILGVLLGLLMLMSGLGSVINPAGRVRAVREFAASPGLQLVGGMLAFVMGSAVVVMVPLSHDLFAICVTVLGWIMLLKGALLILWGDGYLTMAKDIGDRAMPVFGWLMTLAGAALFVTALNELRAETAIATSAAVAAPMAPSAPMEPQTPAPPKP